MGSTKNYIYRATKRHLNIFDISSSLVVAPIWKWVHLFGPGSKIVLFANFHQFQIRIFTFDLIFGPETFVLSIFWRVTAQIRIERATQICFNFLDSSTGLVLTPHESWVPFLFPDRVSSKYATERYPIFYPGWLPMLGQPVRCGQSGLLGRIRPALYKESLAWLILMSFGSVDKRRNCRVQAMQQMVEI